MLTLVIGGARSGKSRYSESLCRDAGRVTLIVTAEPSEDDQEMKRRIARHRAHRPSAFQTVEAPLDVARAVEEAEADYVLVDCVTVWVSNLMFDLRSLTADQRESAVVGEVQGFVTALLTRHAVVVTNDVGSGTVPDNAVAREFRDLQGRTNQMLAEAAERVVWMVAGIPTFVKGGAKQ